MFVNCKGVYDGHGLLGEVASQYAAEKIPMECMKRLKNTFNDTWVNITHKEIRPIDYGTTCVLLFTDGYNVIVANCGDSRCLMIPKKQKINQNKQNKHNDKDDDSSHKKIDNQNKDKKSKKSKEKENMKEKMKEKDKGCQKGMKKDRKYEWHFKQIT